MMMVIEHQRGNRKSASLAILQHGRKNCPNAPILATGETIREMANPNFPAVEMSADHKTLLEREMSAETSSPTFPEIRMSAGNQMLLAEQEMRGEMARSSPNFPEVEM